MPVDVTSEIGQLQTVLVHTHGRELEAVTPGNRDDYLYDDIIDLEIAQREHRQFVAAPLGMTEPRSWSARRADLALPTPRAREPGGLARICICLAGGQHLLYLPVATRRLLSAALQLQ